MTIHPLLLPTLILPTVTIQGRLKGPEYVAITTKAYRLAVDDAWTKLLASQPLEIEQSLAIESSSLPPTQTQTQTPQVAGTIASKIKSKISVKTTSAAVVNPSTLSPLDEQLQQDLRQVFARGQDADHDGLSRYLEHFPLAFPSRNICPAPFHLCFTHSSQYIPPLPLHSFPLPSLSIVVFWRVFSISPWCVVVPRDIEECT